MSRTKCIAPTMVANASKQQSLTGFLRPTAKRDIGTSSSIAVKVASPKNGESERQPTLSVHLDHEVPSDILPIANKRRKIDPAGSPTILSSDGAKSAVQAISTSHKSSTAEQSEPSGDTDYPPPDHPSYHLPPSGSYNHPFTIPPIPQSLSSSLAFNTNPKVIAKPELGLDLLYFKRFIDATCSSELTQYLLDSMPWYRVKYVVRGISINTPRYTTVFGKDATTTPWHGYDKAEPRAIPPILLKLMQKGESPPTHPFDFHIPVNMTDLVVVEEVTGETYNFTLVNYYADGTDSISYHSDSESFLGPNPCIASLSLGAPRDFMLRHVKYKENKVPVEKFNLTTGDMVVMRGRTQHDWQHSIPKRSAAQGRINITFRKGVVKYATQNYYQYNVGKGPLYRWQKGKMVEQV